MPFSSAVEYGEMVAVRPETSSPLKGLPFVQGAGARRANGIAVPQGVI